MTIQSKSNVCSDFTTGQVITQTSMHDMINSSVYQASNNDIQPEGIGSFVATSSGIKAVSGNLVLKSASNANWIEIPSSDSLGICGASCIDAADYFGNNFRATCYVQTGVLQGTNAGLNPITVSSVMDTVGINVTGGQLNMCGATIQCALNICNCSSGVRIIGQKSNTDSCMHDCRVWVKADDALYLQSGQIWVGNNAQCQGQTALCNGICFCNGIAFGFAP